jgi:nucleoside-diphosphate-sugar epimerase
MTDTMGKVLVTGASGFIGYHLVKALVAHGDEVTCLVRPTSSLDRIKPLGVALACGDVTEAESLLAPVEGKAVVYNVAGCTRALTRRELHRVNEEGCRHVVQACAAATTPPVLVHVSSLAAAGPSPRGRLRSETDPLQPVSHYGRSKRAGESAAEPFADRVPITVVRPAIVLGEADAVGLSMFSSVARSRLHFVVGWAPRQYSIIHAADLAEMMILAAQRGARLPPPSQRRDEPSNAQGYYFAACNEHPTFGQLGKMLGEALGCRFVVVMPVAVPVAWLAAAGAEVVGQVCRRPFFFRLDKFREASASSWACSPQKAMDDLGFSVRMPLLDRLRQTVQWYRREKWL